LHVGGASSGIACHKRQAFWLGPRLRLQNSTSTPTFVFKFAFGFNGAAQAMQVRFASTATLAPRGTTDRGQWRVKGTGGPGDQGPNMRYTYSIDHTPNHTPKPHPIPHTLQPRGNKVVCPT